MRRGLLLLAVAVSLWPVWTFRYLPTQDGASHTLNARVFRECERAGSPEHELYARRWNPVPNWTAQALLLGLTTLASPDTAEKVLASLYLVGLPLAVAFFMTALGPSGEAALFALLLAFNRCFFLGFSNYLLSLVLYFVLIGLFLRRSPAPPRGEIVGLSLFLLLIWFTHLFGYLLAAASLLWLAATGPGARKPRVEAVILALLPSSLLTLSYLVTSGFFEPGVARKAAQGLSSLGPDVPAALHRELFAIHASAWPIGLLGLVVATLWLALARAKGEGASSGLKGWGPSLAGLSAAMLLAFALVPDHLGAQGGFFKARLAPLPFLLGLGLLPEAPRGRRRAIAVVTLVLLLGLNLTLVRAEFAAADRDLREFTAAASFVKPGETLFALKPRPEGQVLVDVRAAEHYCLAAHAVCLGNYEAATRHFPVRLRPGVKERLKENRPGTFWADVILAWDAALDQLPLADEPYHEVYRRGPLRLYRRDAHGLFLRPTDVPQE